MAVQVQTLNQFIITLCPEETQNAINNVFKNFYDQPLPVMCEGINNIQYFIRDKNNPLASAAAINGIVIGILMARVSETQSQIFEGWLDEYRKVKGEHVIDFQQHLAKRRQ